MRDGVKGVKGVRACVRVAATGGRGWGRVGAQIRFKTLSFTTFSFALAIRSRAAVLWSP